jgi:hypothetical protein
MLKKGFAWHYAAYDKRAELAKVKQYYESITPETAIHITSLTEENPWRLSSYLACTKN